MLLLSGVLHRDPRILCQGSAVGHQGEQSVFRRGVIAAPKQGPVPLPDGHAPGARAGQRVGCRRLRGGFQLIGAVGQGFPMVLSRAVRLYGQSDLPAVQPPGVDQELALRLGGEPPFSVRNGGEPGLSRRHGRSEAHQDQRQDRQDHPAEAIHGPPFCLPECHGTRLL